jgi:hypothetical protein
MAENKKVDSEALHDLAVLHRYWIAADSVKIFVGMTVPDEKGHSHRLERPNMTAFDPQYISSFYRLSIWYALLYVVAEEYREKEYADETIDKLLADEKMVGLLRRSRNATFHFQRDFFSEKFWGLYLEAGSEKWVQELHRAFDRFFVGTVVHEAKNLWKESAP